jgi:subtilisin family serine protease
MYFMGKRLASGSGLGRKFLAMLSPAGAYRLPVDRRAFEMAQQLEPRLMLSTTPNVVTVNWQGHSVQAYAGQYVAETADLTRFDRLAAKEGFTDVTSLGGSGYYSFDSTLAVSALNKLAVNDRLTFKSLAPNAVGHLASTVPSDPEIPNQWALQNTGQVEPYDYNGDGLVTPYNQLQNPTPPATIPFPSPPYLNENRVGTVGQDINATNAWDITTGSKNVVVAVLDSGIDLTHPDLTSNLWTNPLDTTANGMNGDGFPDDVNGWNFVDGDSDVQDDFGHGTAVAGVIGAAGNNTLGVSGVDWNVSLLTVKIADFSGAVSDANEIAGINYCVTLKNLGINIVVMNQSVEGTAEFPQNLLLADALQRATKAGILDVVSAGNDGDPVSLTGANLDAAPVYPAAYSLSNPNIITVAATDNQGLLANFSNYGSSTVDLAAPGVDIMTTSPVIESLLSFEISDENPDIQQFTPSYGYLSGTSMSAAFVSGIIALEASANPLASPAQLKSALLYGVTYDPALAASNGLPAKVLTSGVANAYNAVQNILNDFSSVDSTTEGNWVNAYGSQGSVVVGATTSYPSFVTVQQTGGAPVILSNTTKNPAGLQLAATPTQRISAYQASASTESISLDFTDGQVHQTALYLADLDRKNRAEFIQVIDNVTGSVLDTRVINDFTKGKYLIYDLRGNVTLKLTNNGGPTVVYSGLFFDATPTAPTTYTGTSTSTTGANWRNLYGSQGAVVVGDSTQVPAYVSTFSVLGAASKILRAKTSSSNSLEKITDPNSNIESYWSSATHLDLNIGTNDGLAHDVTLYLADYDHKKRQERIQVIDSPTGNILAQQDITNFTTGQYVSFQITGSVTFRISDLSGPNAVVSGIFFDAPFGQKASYLGTDTTTGGNWRQSQFGLTTAYVVGDNFPGFDDPQNSLITNYNASEAVLSYPSGSSAALYKTSVTKVTNRIEAYLYSNTSFELSYNPGDLLNHTVALYFADYQNDHRLEVVTIYNPATLQVETKQVVSNFSKGKYLLFDISGEALITVSNGGYPNAVLSGVFTN